MTKHFAFIPGLLILAGCSLNNTDYNLKGISASPTMALPLIQGNLGLLDLFKAQDSSYVRVYSDGLIYLTYDQALVSQDIRNLINIPDVSATRSVSVPQGNYPPVPSDYNSTVNNSLVNMPIAPEQLTEIGFKSGVLNYNLSLFPANPNFLYAIVMTIPEFRDANGQFFSTVVTGLGSASLAGYTYSSAIANQFNLQLTLVVKKNPNSVSIPSGTTVKFNLALTGLNFRYIKGFFGDQTTTTPLQTINLTALGNTLIKGSQVTLQQPIISLTAVNDYVVPLQVNFITLLAQKPGGSIPFTISPPNPIAVNYPVVLGTSASTTVNVTNVAQVINFAPTQMVYQVSGRMNAGLSGGINSMADTSKLRVKMHIEIPLYGSASNIILTDTVALNLSTVNQTQVEKATLQTNIINQIPLNASLQLYLIDKNNQVLDSLFSSSQNPIVKGSTVTSSGALQSAGVSNQPIDLDSVKVSKIFLAAKMILVARMSTSGSSTTSTSVKFESQYKLKANIGLLVKLKLNTTF